MERWQREGEASGVERAARFGVLAGVQGLAVVAERAVVGLGAMRDQLLYAGDERALAAR